MLLTIVTTFLFGILKGFLAAVFICYITGIKFPWDGIIMALYHIYGYIVLYWYINKAVKDSLSRYANDANFLPETWVQNEQFTAMQKKAFIWQAYKRKLFSKYNVKLNELQAKVRTFYIIK